MTALLNDLDQLTADPGRARRISVSIVLATAITVLEVFVAFSHWPRETPTERVIATTVVLERAPKPTPRPKPRPTLRPAPTPKPLPRATLAPVERAAPAAAHHAGGASAARHLVLHHQHPRDVARPKAPAAIGVALAPGNGSGLGSGNGADSDAGSGTGNGAGGTGTGAVNADAPCGYVEFVPDASPKIVGTTSYETIRTTVHYPDGHTASEEFPYPWVYADYMATDPWSPVNVRQPNEVVYAQLPPPGTDTHRYGDVVRYVIDHTDALGHTVLQPCPR